MDDCGRFLSTNRRYSKASKHSDDRHKFIHEVAKAHDGSDTAYESKIRTIIDHNKLTRYDKPTTQLTEAEIAKAFLTNAAKNALAMYLASTQDPVKALWQAQASIPPGAQQEALSRQTSAQSSRLKM